MILVHLLLTLNSSLLLLDIFCAACCWTLIYFISAAHNHWCYLVWIIPMNWLLTLKRLLFQILCKRVCLFIRLPLWKDVTQILRRISNTLPTVYYLTLLYVVPSRFFPFHLCYLYFFRQYKHFHVYFIKSGSQFISALLVKGIVFCCCSCYCYCILLFCLFYSFVPIQLRESATLFHPRIKEI